MADLRHWECEKWTLFVVDVPSDISVPVNLKKKKKKKKSVFWYFKGGLSSSPLSFFELVFHP